MKQTAALKIQNCFRSSRRWKPKVPETSFPSRSLRASTSGHSSGQVTARIDDRLLVSRTVVEQLAVYKQQVDDLSKDLMNVTAEAELHKQEVESEFEERLVEYEEEVLSLKQNIQRHEEEKATLKAEIAANVENVNSLKTGIRSMQGAHRDYLGKVMRAIEKATVEHRYALDALKHDRDSQITVLRQEISRLKKLRRKGASNTTERRENDVYQLARKLEKLISPDNIAAVAAKAYTQEKANVDVFEDKISSRARKIIYQLEDVASSPAHSAEETCDDKECIQMLQQQLVVAYEEIETLQTRAECRDASGVRRGALRRMFDR